MYIHRVNWDATPCPEVQQAVENLPGSVMGKAFHPKSFVSGGPTTSMNRLNENNLPFLE